MLVWEADEVAGEEADEAGGAEEDDKAGKCAINN
jgi:hypothetical protein